MLLSRLGPFRVAGSATAYPSDLVGAAVRYDNRRAYEASTNPEELDVDHPRTAWGVEVRDWCRGTELTSLDLAARACELAVAAAGWTSFDVLVAATCTPVHATKCFAAEVARRFGWTAAAVDVRGGGAGGLDAWITAASLLAAGAERALVVAAEATSLWFDERDVKNGLLFGDGAGALALESSADSTGQLVRSEQGTAGARGRAFTVPGALPPTRAQLDAGEYVFQAPDAAYRGALAELWHRRSAALAGFLEDADLGVVHYLPYAVTRAQVLASCEPLGADPVPALDQLARHGCLGCAGPIAAAATALNSGELRAGDLLASLAIGGGIRWSTLVWRL